MIFHGNEPNCLIKRTIGVPCPLCGMTRSIYSLCTFQFKDAFIYHPFILFMPLIFIVIMFKGINQIDTLFHNTFFWITMIFILLVIYIGRMVLFFPDVSPMNYYRQAFISLLQ
jgi:hypothetical protein